MIAVNSCEKEKEKNKITTFDLIRKKLIHWLSLMICYAQQFLICMILQAEDVLGSKLELMSERENRTISWKVKFVVMKMHMSSPRVHRSMQTDAVDVINLSRWGKYEYCTCNVKYCTCTCKTLGCTYELCLCMRLRVKDGGRVNRCCASGWTRWSH